MEEEGIIHAGGKGKDAGGGVRFDLDGAHIEHVHGARRKGGGLMAADGLCLAAERFENRHRGAAETRFGQERGQKAGPVAVRG